MTTKSSGRVFRELISARSAMISFQTISCNVDSVGSGLVGDVSSTDCKGSLQHAGSLTRMTITIVCPFDIWWRRVIL